MTKKAVASFLFILLIFSGADTSVASDQDAMVLPELSSTRLLNDLQVYVASTPFLGDAMTIGLILRYGAAFDPANKGGVAYLTSQLLAKATVDKTAKDIQDELKYLNSSLEVRCDWDGIRILLSGQSASFERSLLFLYQLVGEAKFDDEDFAGARSALLQQLQALSDPRQRIRSQFDVELFRGTTYGRPMRGTPATVQNITVGDIRYFYRRYFSPDQASLVIVGNAPAETVLQKSRRIWGVWVRGDDVPSTFLQPREQGARNIFLEDDPLSPAAQFVLGNLWPSRGDPMYYSATLAARMLQERLTLELPTSLLTAAAEARRLSGPFYIQGQAAAEEAFAEITKIIDTVDSFKESGQSPEKIAAAQTQWIEEFGKAIRTTDGICHALLDAELYRLGVNYLATFSDSVRRCSPALIKDAAKRYLFPGGLVLIVRGPAAILQPQLESLGSVQPLRR
ncbi:MAG: peptidase domain protein [Acidobacteria bacterium]|nr:peptidase domain protein [Acidobacteriota bacterium]